MNGNEPRMIHDRTFQVGGQEITLRGDAAVFLVDGGSEAALIDSGCGPSVPAIIENISAAGVEASRVQTLILTHCHIDHCGGAKELKKRLGCRILVHELDAPALENADQVRTAASWYEIELAPLEVDTKLKGRLNRVQCGDVELHVLHTPGHTPGSVAVYTDIAGKRVLFGQDIHGPFDEVFGSDIADWRRSMKGLMDLNADILCEGHLGIFKPATIVKDYIEGYLRRHRDR
jgi:glyoxylase-like metal-dependent hydrolase (beta-lactamase superfamily II)